MHALIRQVTDTPFAPGKAWMWWLGQMGLLVKMGSTVLCLDYFASLRPGRQVMPPVPMEEMEGIDAFLGTHNHLDHMDHEAWKVWARVCPGAGFVFPALHMQEVLADGISEDRCRGLTDGGTCRVGEVTVHAIAASHEFLDPDPATGLYPCLQYVLEGNGVRIYHAGDTVRYEGMLPKLQKLGRMDAALLPINGRDAERYRRGCIGNMTFQEAADLAGELQVGLVMPGHFDMFRDNPGDPAAFRDYVEAKYQGSVKVQIPRYAAPIRVSAGA